jgi:hypothetical protein
VDHSAGSQIQDRFRLQGSPVRRPGKIFEAPAKLDLCCRAEHSPTRCDRPEPVLLLKFESLKQEGSLSRVGIGLRDLFKILRGCAARIPVEVGLALRQRLQHILVGKLGVARVRVGLNRANPPITRVVVDLDSLRPYASRSQAIKCSSGFCLLPKMEPAASSDRTSSFKGAELMLRTLSANEEIALWQSVGMFGAVQGAVHSEPDS